MPRTLTTDVDPVFAEVAKAIYGEDVDPRELLEKFSPGDSDLHIDGSDPKARKRARTEAAIGLGASSVATVAGLDAMRTSVQENKDRVARAEGREVIERGPSKVARALRKIPGATPKRVAVGIGAGLMGLHGVELVGDALGAKAQVKQLQATKPKKPDDTLVKAFRLKALNPLAINKVPSLRAKRPRTNPTAPGTLFGKSAEEVTWTAEIAKVDTEKRQVFGWASVSEINGEPVVDLQGDIVPIEELEKAAYTYVLESRKGGDMHTRIAKADTQPLHTADLIESFVVTPEKLEKMGLAHDALPLGWWTGFKVNDDTQWDLVKQGKRTGFSIHGLGTRTPVSKALPGKHRLVAIAEGAKHRASTDTNKWVKIERKSEHSWGPVGPKHLAKAEHRLPDSDTRQYSGRHRAVATDRARAGMGGKHAQAVGNPEPWVNTAPKHSASKSTRASAPVKRLIRRIGAKAQTLEDSQPLAGKLVRWAIEKDASDVKDKATKRLRRVGESLKERTTAALHPLPVKLRPVDSEMADKMGYQQQTRRLTYEMRNGRKYTYRAKPALGNQAMSSRSKGQFYNYRVKHKATPTDRVSLAGRARLFANPNVEKAASTQPTTLPTSGGPTAPMAKPAAGGPSAPAAGSAPRKTLKPVAPKPVAPTPPTPPVAKRFVSAEKRRQLTLEGKARPGGRFPIENATDARAARKLIDSGHGSPADAAFVNRREEQLGITKAALPDDNATARRARDRKKAGLGLAGVGYLAASRGKEVAPHYADLITRKVPKAQRTPPVAGPGPKNVKVGPKTTSTAEAARAAKVLHRGERIGAASTKLGAIGTIAGIGLAGEGFTTDLVQRHVFDRAKKRVQRRIHPSEG